MGVIETEILSLTFGTGKKNKLRYKYIKVAVVDAEANN